VRRPKRKVELVRAHHISFRGHLERTALHGRTTDCPRQIHERPRLEKHPPLARSAPRRNPPSECVHDEREARPPRQLVDDHEAHVVHGVPSYSLPGCRGRPAMSFMPAEKVVTFFCLPSWGFSAFLSPPAAACTSGRLMPGHAPAAPVAPRLGATTQTAAAATANNNLFLLRRCAKADGDLAPLVLAESRTLPKTKSATWNSSRRIFQRRDGDLDIHGKSL